MKIVIAGSGAFGTAIANALVRPYSEIIIYGINEKEIDDINKNSKNSAYYSKKLNTRLAATSNPRTAFYAADIILIAVPSPFVEDLINESILPNIVKPAYFVNLAKGMDLQNFLTFDKILEKLIPKDLNLGILKLAGPSFAVEIIRKQPTLFTLASKNIEVANYVAKNLRNKYIHIEVTTNISEVELTSVLKNPYSLLLGIVSGLGYQTNAKAMIFTKIIREMQHIFKNLDFNIDSISSSAGIGDLYLTGTSIKSRNYRMGYKLGKTDKFTKKVALSFETIEGVQSIEPLIKFMKRKEITCELLEALYDIIINKKIPSVVIEQVLS